MHSLFNKTLSLDGKEHLFAANDSPKFKTSICV